MRIKKWAQIPELKGVLTTFKETAKRFEMGLLGPSDLQKPKAATAKSGGSRFLR